MTKARIPFAPAYDHLVYLRVFEGCNLHCQHCFIPSNPKRMTAEDIARVPEDVRKIAPPGSTILLQWHGGEPTMFGAAWLREAIESIEASGPEYKWVHGIQTNLLTYDESWAHLYKDHFGGNVGVSWDQGIRLLRRNDPASSAAFEKVFWPKLQKLIDDGLSPYLVVTGTKVFFEHFRNPVDFFEMLAARGIRRGHIERITETGYARENWERVGVSNGEWSRHMSRFLRAYVRWHQAVEGGRDLQLSPFDGLVQSAQSLIAGTPKASGCLSGSCDTTFHTIDSNGYKRGCTAITSEYDNKRADKDRALRITDPVAARKDRQIFNCHLCEFRPICKSGCLAIDFDDGSGECSGGSILLTTAKKVAELEKKELVS